METKDLLKDNRIHHGHNIKRIRDIKGVELAALESVLQMSRENIVKFEEMKVVDDAMLEKFAKALDVSVETIKEMREESPSVKVEYTNNTFNNENSPSLLGSTNNIGSQCYNLANDPIMKVVEAYSLMLKQERERSDALEKRIVELEKLLKEKE